MAQRLARRDANVTSIIPRPVSVRSAPGYFEFHADTVIGVQPQTAAAGAYLARSLAPATGWDLALRQLPVRRLPVRRGGSSGETQVILRLSPPAAQFGDEGYALDVTPAQVVITGATPAGVFYGVQSLMQLLPPAVWRSVLQPGARWRIPGIRITDHPRFAWRGLMLDSARYYMPTSFIKRLFDLMALHKLNRFHWHLTDDQGWRLEIKRYPKLTSVGAWRAETVVGHESNRPKYMDGVPHGGFYTRDDVRELVAYARERMITIIPEIEMPGHAQAAIAAYPELGCTGRRLPVSTHWGVHTTLFNTEAKTIRFLQNVLSEVIELFPGSFIHIGGDEAVKDQWQASPRIQAHLRKLHLKDERALQAWFIRNMDRFLAARGRRLIGWEEILEGGLAKGAVVMAWRQDGAAALEATGKGHDVVMAPQVHTYFDWYQSDAHEPLAIGGYLPLQKVYEFEPVPPKLKASQATRILGAQGQLWSEYLPTPSQTEYMAFPRTAALAEVVWSPAWARNYADFQRRLNIHLRRLDMLGVNYRRSG